MRTSFLRLGATGPVARSSRRSSLRRVGLALVATFALAAVMLVPVATSEPAAAATDGQMIVPTSGNIQSKVGDGCRGDVRTHQGIDITGPGGQPIVAAYDGVIKARSTNLGYGNFTDIEHPGGYVTRYAHMASAGTYAPGTRVERGQQIGVVGKTGNTTAFHLHFEVWRNGVVYTAINQGFTCLTNVTRGSVIPMTFPGLGTPLPPRSPASDYDGDGRNDLLVVAADSDLRIILGAAGGAFGASEIVTSAWGANRHLVHSDFDGDGRADLLVVRGDGILELYSGATGRGFGGYDIIGTGWNDMRHLASGADYSGDGRHDILAATSAGALFVYRSDGNRGIAGATPVGSGWQSMRHLVGGDFNDDGSGDIMAVDDGGTLHFYAGVNGGFSSPRRIGGGWSSFAGLTGGVDYDLDGHVDLLAHTTAGELLLYPGDGGGWFGMPRTVGAIPTGNVLFE